MKAFILASLAVAILAIVSLVAAESAKESAPATSVPASARVPFPKNYASGMTPINQPHTDEKNRVTTVFMNAPAAAVVDLAKLPYPDGAVFVMEWADVARAANGEPARDANGQTSKGKIFRLDVMQHGKNYGESYGDKRAGEWEFTSYRPDGSDFPNVKPASCAGCHAKASERDFVFRGRFPLFQDK